MGNTSGLGLGLTGRGTAVPAQQYKAEPQQGAQLLRSSEEPLDRPLESVCLEYSST